MDSIERKVRYRVWCPLCEEEAVLTSKAASEGLAENHDENYHCGDKQTIVSVVRCG